MFKNKFFNAIITKFLLVVTVFGLTLPAAAGINTSSAVAAAAVQTLLAFLAADLLVLPRYGNLAAVAVDALLTVVVARVIISLLENTVVPFPGLAIIAVLTGAGEWYYHQYLARLFFRGRIKR